MRSSLVDRLLQRTVSRGPSDGWPREVREGFLAEAVKPSLYYFGGVAREQDGNRASLVQNRKPGEPRLGPRYGLEIPSHPSNN